MTRLSRKLSGVIVTLVLACTGVGHALAMNFRLVPLALGKSCGQKCPKIITAEGEIEGDTAASFVRFLSSHRHDSTLRSVVLLNSPGGSVEGSIKLGLVIRRLHMATIVARAVPLAGQGTYQLVSGRCYSACVYAFMGGSKRVLPRGSVAGIHRAYIPGVGPDPVGHAIPRAHRGPRTSINPDVAALAIARYSQRMGISLDLLRTAERVSPASIHIVTPREARAWHLAVSKF